MKRKKYWIMAIIVLATVVIFGIGIIIILLAEKKEDSSTNNEQLVTKELSSIKKTTEEINTTEVIATEAVLTEPVEISLSEIPEIDKLYTFLTYYEGYGTLEGNDFDCTNPPADFLSWFLFSPIPIADTSIAPNYYDEVYSEAYADPLGQFPEGYRKVNINGLNWTLQNVYNISYDTLTQIETDYLNERTDVYQLDGYYYIEDLLAGYGRLDSYYDIVNAKFDGTYYYFTIDDYLKNDYINNGYSTVGIAPQKCRYEIKMELKEIDGTVFWSLYNCQNLMADWARAYNQYIYDNEWFQDFFDPEANEMVYTELDIAYLDEDDIPELIFLRQGYRSLSYILSYQNGSIVSIPLDFGVLKYIEKENLFYAIGNAGNGIEWEAVYKIENEEFVEIGLHFEQSPVDDGSGTYIYKWESQDVSQEEYERLLSETFDFDKAVNSSYLQLNNINTVGDLYGWLEKQYK